MLRGDNPNILLIVLDTVRRDRLSAYGNPRETSPELDAFAACATLFERAIAPAQWTTPSHASMFTGLYPSGHRVTQGNFKLAESIPTLAEILGCAGYHTVAFCNNSMLVTVLCGGRLQLAFVFLPAVWKTSLPALTDYSASRCIRGSCRSGRATSTTKATPNDRSTT